MTIDVLAPAKLNLGLEVIRRRDDGYHDIATVFQTISVFDRLRLSPATEERVRIVDCAESIGDNLVERALALARENALTSRTWYVELEKRIPLAAGLGGASSDAAATLLALAEHEGKSSAGLSSLALDLGSDVPFLLQGGAALGSGRGELLEPLPSLTGCWLVLASPSVAMDRKTAQLFGSLQPEDFSDGARTQRVAMTLRARQFPDPSDLANAFERPLTERLSNIDALHQAFHRAGAPFIALSGAGPTHYTILPTLEAAIRIARQLAEERPIPMRVLLARPTSSGPLLRRYKTARAAGAL